MEPPPHHSRVSTNLPTNIHTYVGFKRQNLCIFVSHQFCCLVLQTLGKMKDLRIIPVTVISGVGDKKLLLNIKKRRPSVWM